MPISSTSPFIRKIFVAVDNSEQSRWAQDVAVEFAQKYAAGLVLIHVVDPSVAISAETGVILPDHVEELRKGGRALLDRAAASIPPSLPCEKLLREGKPPREIDLAARDLGADLIVIGTHSRGGLVRLLLGSVADAVVRHAPCPVLTVGVDPKLPRTASASLV